ncbi:MAG: hormogonium polysaccharide biosynthesis glycosyltransferase HpsE [Xenococcaceae cyanobacterium MO_188.B19]|nr:hormogonium polysaccharide biosynthesis glycosyltransferase HpsE [Xenococcaceae cyanobacterium MO_188.B19]MDJ0678874.1 hormogonium polysaccharide biosynthesis glycosyltransferase HpsE [Xenococcaceae cyanobacterium MO_167.B52]
MVDFTVAIRTYNSAKTIPKVLDRLLLQVDTEDINWEVIVVDNNSTDNTVAIVKNYQSKWDKTYPLKYYCESRQGRAFARYAAIKEAKGDLIGFLDDDNLPASNWVSKAYIFGQSHSQAGAYGGQIHGQFEIEPPPNFNKIARFFALIEGPKTYCYNQKYIQTNKKMFPPGAGIVIRKKAWVQSVPQVPRLIQTAEDIEMLSYIWQAGWEIWFNPEMEINHLISKSRFENKYLINFFRSNGLTRHYVRMLNYQSWQKPFVIPAYILNDISKVIIYLIKYWRIINTDIVAAVQLELLLCTLISPLYVIGKHQLKI